MGMTYKRGTVWWVKYYRSGQTDQRVEPQQQGIRRNQPAEAP